MKVTLTLKEATEVASVSFLLNHDERPGYRNVSGSVVPGDVWLVGFLLFWERHCPMKDRKGLITTGPEVKQE